MIRVFRLTTGEDLIGDKQESGQDTTTIKKPFVLLPMQPAPGKPVSVGFTPYSPYANSDTITIKTANIISEVEPKTELANAYKKNTRPLCLGTKTGQSLVANSKRKTEVEP